MNTPSPAAAERTVTVAVADLDRFCRDVLRAAGGDPATVDAVARAIMHGSRLGVDSHGVRLLDHYVTVLTGGRVNPRPDMAVVDETGAVASLDADHGHGALATYTAMNHAMGLARRFGIGAVAIRNSSHFGPAGAFALAAAEAGLIGLVMCNSDSFVRLHDGAAPFHGTNPIACAVPVAEGRPWLLDMATSTIPYNRMLLFRSLGRPLPAGAASGADGIDTQDAEQAAMLAPVGGTFGFKGAGLAGLIEILSAGLSGMRLSFDILPMGGPDFRTPREMGAFVLAIQPGAFVEPAMFHDAVRRYRDALRQSRPRSDAVVLAPGDREWAEADRRQGSGVPIDPTTEQAFERLARDLAVAPPTWRRGP